MPLVENKYTPPFIFRNYHISTIYASAFRKVKKVEQVRERLELEDRDFLDLDWSYSKASGSRKVLITLHGLEGNAQRPYMLGMAGKFNDNGWDVASINFRGCSGEMNNLYRSYNAGATEDLEQVILHILQRNKYEKIALVGFSLGGNLMLKFLGEGRKLSSNIKAAVAISTPCDLYKSLKKLEERKNWLYSRRFVTKLKEQLYARSKKFPGEINKDQINNCKSLYDIDDLYTGKAHGFKNARDYYEKNSSLQFIPNIEIPTLIINAQNDEFLSKNSSPIKIARKKENIFLEMPEFGGHVGFIQKTKDTFSEIRALNFIQEHL